MRWLRPYWEIHRHRMAPEVANRFRTLLDRGDVQLIAGRVASAEAQNDRVRLLLIQRGILQRVELSTDWVVNCTGPTASNSAEANPAIGSLLVDGWISPDELSLGVDTTKEGNAVDANHRSVTDLFIIGTLRKPALWETTAVAELRNQAETAAAALIELLSTKNAAVDQTDADVQTKAIIVRPTVASKLSPPLSDAPLLAD